TTLFRSAVGSVVDARTQPPGLLPQAIPLASTIRTALTTAAQPDPPADGLRRDDMAGYPFKDIESKWQRYWEEHGTFRTPDDVDTSKPKYYVLDMFPYPSGDGLHVGHPEGYTASDIVARNKRLRGFSMLHAIGGDAFGLPAEQYAVRTGTHPKITPERTIERFRKQLKALGLSYDWSRAVNTTDPAYYR